MKMVCLKHISNCLKCDKVRYDIVNEFGGLNSIINTSNSDLMDNKLLIIKRKLRKMAPFAIFLVLIHFIFYSINNILF